MRQVFSLGAGRCRIDGLEAKRAGELIMTARAPWFAEAEAEEQQDQQ